MMAFPEGFVSGLIHGSIGLTVLGAVTMLVLLVADLRSGRLW